MLDDEQGDVIARKRLEIRVDAEEQRGFRDGHARFFVEFPAQGAIDFFAAFDTAAGEVPAGAVAVPDEQYA